jgi:dTDP-4-dehydrorhamnose 3,5-epimerase
MRFQHTHIAGLVEIFPRIFHDERGSFFESFQQKLFDSHGIPAAFVQDNQSFSRKGVIRGLHFQKEPFAQGKLVRVITGKVVDVVVDLRIQSPTFGQHAKFLLDSALGNMLYVPEGFAHGFAALEDATVFYKCTNGYNKASESGIVWNDPQLNINWEITHPIISEKDLALPSFQDILNVTA